MKSSFVIILICWKEFKCGSLDISRVSNLILVTLLLLSLLLERNWDFNFENSRLNLDLIFVESERLELLALLEDLRSILTTCKSSEKSPSSSMACGRCRSASPWGYFEATSSVSRPKEDAVEVGLDSGRSVVVVRGGNSSEEGVSTG